jgi:hypothetical protein
MGQLRIRPTKSLGLRETGAHGQLGMPKNDTWLTTEFGAAANASQ